MADFIVTLEDCYPSDTGVVGGKATGLGVAIRSGYPVPSGFVVSTGAYLKSVAGIEANIQSILCEALAEDKDKTGAAAARIRALFESLEFDQEVTEAITLAYDGLCQGNEPVPVAVRSSATAEDTEEASFAGQQETYLWISGIDQVLLHIKRCWASLYTERAIAYRSLMKTPEENLAMAVVVQTMVNAEAAGVMMTLNPVSGDRGAICIESAFGLGEGVVGGEIDADRYLVEKKAFALISEHIGHKKKAYQFIPAMNQTDFVVLPEHQQSEKSIRDSEVVALAKIGQKIEDGCGQPMDIEWAIATDQDSGERKIFILQIRPETVWSKKGAEEPPSSVIGRQDSWDPIQSKSSPGEYWTTSNVGEAAPGVLTPLSWTVWWPAAEAAHREAWHKIGVYDADEQFIPDNGSDSFCKIFYGRLAWQVKSLAILGDRSPGTTGKDVVEGTFGRVPEGFQFEPTKRCYPKIYWHRLLLFLFLPRKLKEFAAESSSWWRQAQKTIPTLPRDKAVELFIQAQKRFYNAQFMSNLSVHGLIQPLFSFLARLVSKTGIGEVSDVSAVSGNTEMAMVSDIWDASRGNLTLEEVIEKQGFHGPLEGELSSRVWREDSRPLSNLIERYTSRDDSFDPALLEVKRRQKLTAIECEILEELPSWKRPYTRYMLSQVRKLLPLRGVAKCSFLEALDVMRACARRIGEHLVDEGLIDQADDVFYLTANELTGVSPKDVKNLINLRKARRSAYQQLSIPDAWEGMPQPELKADADMNSIPENALNKIEGIGVSRGVVEGRVRVVLDPNFAEIQTDEILVAPTTDPSWSSIMFISSAMIVDIGAMLSHTAVVARELGLPCVVNTRYGTKQLRTGDLVRVDGSTGVVHVLERSQEHVET